MTATERGVRLNDEVLRSLQESSAQIAKVVTVVDEITAASAGQAAPCQRALQVR